MAMHQLSHLSLLLLLLLTSSIAASAAPISPTAYEMLEKFDFPKGILPLGVERYTLQEDGSFEVFLRRDCQFKVEGSYLLNYQKRITGKVALGRLQDLTGVTVRIFWMHWGIDQVVRTDANDLRFFVGPISQSFPVNNFDKSPQCLCGFVRAVAAVAAM